MAYALFRSPQGRAPRWRSPRLAARSRASRPEGRRSTSWSSLRRTSGHARTSGHEEARRKLTTAARRRSSSPSLAKDPCRPAPRRRQRHALGSMDGDAPLAVPDRRAVAKELQRRRLRLRAGLDRQAGKPRLERRGAFARDLLARAFPPRLRLCRDLQVRGPRARRLPDLLVALGDVKKRCRSPDPDPLPHFSVNLGHDSAYRPCDQSRVPSSKSACAAAASSARARPASVSATGTQARSAERRMRSPSLPVVEELGRVRRNWWPSSPRREPRRERRLGASGGAA